MGFASEFMGLPGLRGYWPMGSLDAAGYAIDLSGQTRPLTYNGNPTYNVVTTYNAPYLDLDGTGDYLSRADESALDILGTESYVASAVRGLTVGGYFWTDTTPGSGAGLIAKDDVSTNRSYVLSFDGTRQVTMAVSLAGSTMVSKINTGTVPATGAWFFAVGVFIPSTSISTFVNNNKETNSTSIPASIFSGSGVLNIGGLNGSFLLDGRVSNCFLCAMALSDGRLTDLYNNTKAYYGL